MLGDEMAETAPAQALSDVQDRIYTATQWQLMWWRFRKHKMALVSTVVLVLFYLIGGFCEFLAPHDPHRYNVKLVLAPPQSLHFVGQDGFHMRPFVYAIRSERNMETLRVEFEVDTTQRYPLRFFVHGDPYKFWGLWETDVHLIGLVDESDPMLLLFGADDMGRDVLSRILYGTRISLSIGLIGVALSLLLGVLIGGISGYFGGVADMLIQRSIEFLRSIPAIPLWLTLAAALPRDWTPIQIYFGITVILSLLGWTGLARVVRGRFLSLREEDFVLAARLSGASELRVILYHMVPSFTSHLVASLTLSIPAMILSETSLSFLGLGLQAPIVSWGVLLQAAQNLRSIVHAPWMFLPGLAIVIAVLAFNFVGDGLRDAADPYAR
jgi:peptide/nickel transport system permease protein